MHNTRAPPARPSVNSFLFSPSAPSFFRFPPPILVGLLSQLNLIILHSFTFTTVLFNYPCGIMFKKWALSHFQYSSLFDYDFMFLFNDPGTIFLGFVYWGSKLPGNGWISSFLILFSCYCSLDSASMLSSFSFQWWVPLFDSPLLFFFFFTSVSYFIVFFGSCGWTVVSEFQHFGNIDTCDLWIWTLLVQFLEWCCFYKSFEFLIHFRFSTEEVSAQNQVKASVQRRIRQSIAEEVSISLGIWIS